MNMMPHISEKTKKILLRFQENEITEYHIYKRIAKTLKNKTDAETLVKIANEEKAHYDLWQTYTDTAVPPRKLKIWLYTFLSRIFGYTFALKKMESGETSAAVIYEGISSEIPLAEQIAAEEEKHENALLEILDEERLQYVGSMVLGLNDALVELTGTLAGLSLALRDTKLIALSGLITGISATLSMASSEYLSARSDGEQNALKSSIYTGVMYIIAVLFLVLPYLLFPSEQYIPALFSMLVTVILIIFIFTYYISVAKSLSFKKRFWEMAGISLSVAAISFVIGILVKQFLGIDV